MAVKKVSGNSTSSVTNSQEWHTTPYGASSNQSHPDDATWSKISSQYTAPSVSSGGSSGGGGSSSSSSASGAISVNPIAGGGVGGYDYASMINSMLEQQRAAAENAYANSKARLDNALSATKDSLSQNLNSTLGQLENNYNYGKSQVTDDANKSLREAYVNYMLNRKNLNQGLSAMGVSGGATESSLANLYNNYGNSRNGINTTMNDNLTNLLYNYQNNLASARQAYNSQYADAMNNYAANLSSLENALANNQMSTYSGSSLSNLANYASTLGGLINQMASQANAYTPTTNTMGISNVSTSSGNNMGQITDYAKYLAEQMRQGTMSKADAMYQLIANGADYNTALQLFS